MESSAGNIQQRQYVRNFEYEYLAQNVAARDYIETVVGIVQESDLEVFDFMLRYQEEICEVVPEIYHIQMIMCLAIICGSHMIASV
jgi:hypothetical protein